VRLPFFCFAIFGDRAAEMVSEIKRVAVIGAGVSGLSTARHLKSQGLEVVVFERSARAGGIW